VTAWLISSAALTGAANCNSNNNNHNGRPVHFGHRSSSAIDSSTSAVGGGSDGHPPLASSWPWIQPGGASAPLVLSRDEELGSVEVTIPMSQSTEVQTSEQDAPLFRDIAMLTDILLDVVKEEDEKIHDLYLEFLKYGKER
jgi:hypothetical protein